MSINTRYFWITENEASNEWFPTAQDAASDATSQGYAPSEITVSDVEADFDEVLHWFNDGIYDGDAYRIFMSDVAGWHYGFDSWDEMASAFSDAYTGEYDSAEDWAETFLDDTGVTGEVPESLRYYIDYASYARDAEMGGDVNFYPHNGGVIVFNGSW